MAMICRTAVCLVLISAVGSSAGAQEFRIETEVYRGAEKQPISENLTLFHGNTVYDFLLSPDKGQFAQEIAIYQQGKFVLLDVGRQTKTTIDEEQVAGLLSAMKANGVLPEAKFLVNPKFEQNYDPAGGWLTLDSDELTYRVRGQAARDETVFQAYSEFMDQFARLNATDPRRMPPFARLKLNAAIRQKKIIPSEVQMTLRPGGVIQRAIEIKARHFVIWQLSSQDHRRIDQAKRFRSEFSEVSLAAFRQLPAIDAGQRP